jgi:hypothetical protein
LGKLIKVNYKFFNRLPVAPRLGERSRFRGSNPVPGEMFTYLNLALMGQR